ncbi:MAG: ABC transporter substrate-binding protein [Deltaproteobacteria bacterium]|nr:ABC transporter substrate-binding protein [Deltaproteobacteria bacterium]
MLPVLLMAVLLLPQALLARDLTVVSWGGAYQEAQRKVYFDPFTKATSSKVLEEEYNGEMAKIKAMVETKNVTWDAVQVEAPELQRGCEEGLFEKLDWEKIGGKQQFIPAAVTTCGVGAIVWSVVLAYDGAKLKEGPKSWADFWDVKKFPGKRALRKGAKFTMEIALQADGVAVGDVYKVLSTPAGVDRAFKKLDQLKGNIQWWEAGAQPPQWLASGDVVMTSAYNGRIAAANKEGKNFKIVWDGQVYALDSWAIPKGTPNLAQAYNFIKFASQPENQKNLPNFITYGPTHVKAVAQVPAEIAVNLPTAPDNLKNSLANSTEFWVSHGVDLDERFNAWASR